MVWPRAASPLAWGFLGALSPGLRRASRALPCLGSPSAGSDPLPSVAASARHKLVRPALLAMQRFMQPENLPYMMRSRLSQAIQWTPCMTAWSAAKQSLNCGEQQGPGCHCD